MPYSQLVKYGKIFIMKGGEIMFAKRVFKRYILTFGLILALVGCFAPKVETHAQELCCDNMHKVTTFIGNRYEYKSHTYNCAVHGVVHYCQHTLTYKIYNVTCTNCGADWGNREVYSGQSHSVSDCTSTL